MRLPIMFSTWFLCVDVVHGLLKEVTATYSVHPIGRFNGWISYWIKFGLMWRRYDTVSPFYVGLCLWLFIAQSKFLGTITTWLHQSSIFIFAYVVLFLLFFLVVCVLDVPCYSAIRIVVFPSRDVLWDREFVGLQSLVFGNQFLFFYLFFFLEDGHITIFCVIFGEVEVLSKFWLLIWF